MSPTITKDLVEQRVVEALVSFGAERETIDRDAEWEPLGIDSLDLVELAQIVEDEYGVHLREEDMTQLLTVGQAIDFVAERAGS
jgi:acyl carrier protein